MSAIKLKKVSWLRRRFVKSEELADLSLWMDEDQKLREKMKTESGLQLVGRKSIIETNSKTQKGHLLLEVVGITQPGFLTQDVSESNVLVLECPEGPFHTDFLALNKKALQIINGTAHSISENYHIVLSGTKLELHFFIQKDYIHS